MTTYQLLLAFLIGMLVNFALQSFGRAIVLVRRLDKHFWLGLTLVAGAFYMGFQLSLSYERPEAAVVLLHRLKLASLLVALSCWTFTFLPMNFPRTRYPRYFAMMAAATACLIPLDSFVAPPIQIIVTRVLGIDFVYRLCTLGPAYLALVFLVFVPFTAIPITRFLTARGLTWNARAMGMISFAPGIVGGFNDFAVTRGLYRGIMISEYLFFIYLVIFSVYIYREDVESARRLANLNEELELRIKQRTMELERANERLRAAAATDMLTGLCNRHQFSQILSLEEHRILRYHGREHQAFSILFIDLDNFKRYNDEFGHAVGDFVLANFATLLRDLLRKSDTAARYGGDEFVALLPNTEEANALVLANRIMRKLEDATGFEREIGQLLGKPCSIPDEWKLGCSIGIASYDKAAAQGGEDILVAADRALYAAKAAGKHCVKLRKESADTPASPRGVTPIDNPSGGA